MNQLPPVLTIDGPSGAGKGTVSRIVARRLGWHYLDSGALYRAVGIAAINALPFLGWVQIVAFVGNRKLTELYRRLVKELSLFRRVNLADGQQIPVSVQEHRAILKAIAAGDDRGDPQRRSAFAGG